MNIESVIKTYKSISVVSFLFGIIFGPILASQGYFKLFIKWLFNSTGNATAYLQYIGSLVGGIATLIALYITVKQTRKIQKDNNKQTKALKEIDNLKMQIEFSKNTFEIAAEYQCYLENVENELEKILRRTKLLDTNEDIDESTNLSEKEQENSYEAMKAQEEIFEDLNVAKMINIINSTIDSYAKRTMIESASISNIEINNYVSLLFEQLPNDIELIGSITYYNNAIDEVREIFNDENSSINISVQLLMKIQVAAIHYITSCQNKINTLIKNEY